MLNKLSEIPGLAQPLDGKVLSMVSRMLVLISRESHLMSLDPDMNGTFQINKGLKIARKLLLQLTEMGLPTAGEFLGA